MVLGESTRALPGRRSDRLERGAFALLWGVEKVPRGEEFSFLPGRADGGQ